jgi:hypothetical protein
MFAPGPPDAPFQVVDVRDLAIFMLDHITARDSGVYGVVGPDEPIAMRDVLETARDAADANTTFTWASEAFLNVKGAFIQIMALTWDSFLLPVMDRHPWLTI